MAFFPEFLQKIFFILVVKDKNFEKSIKNWCHDGSYPMTRNKISCVAQLSSFNFCCDLRDIWPLTPRIITNSGKSRFSGLLSGEGKIRYIESRLYLGTSSINHLNQKQSNNFTKLKKSFINCCIQKISTLFYKGKIKHISIINPDASKYQDQFI